jgi:PBP1b-binding outer membrane lipoprotein LpoB
MKKLKVFLAVLTAVFFISGCAVVQSILTNPATLVAIATEIGELVVQCYPAVASQLVTKAQGIQAATSAANVDVATLDAAFSTLSTVITTANNTAPNSNFAKVMSDIGTITSNSSLAATDVQAILNGFITGLQGGKVSAKLGAVGISPAGILGALTTL